MRGWSSLFLGVSAISIAMASGAAHAQDAATQPPTPPAGAAGDTQQNTVQEVVVTAQRREQRLTDVPISISVVSADKVANSGVVSTRDLSVLVPGLVSGQAGYTFQPSIRGISSTGTGAGDESNVALYVDGVYMSSMGSTAFNLANIDRIEVSKGPQGTLFGRNATGGAIRVETSNPSFTPETRMVGSFGFTGAESKEFTFYTTMPVNDKLAFSLSGYAYDDDGYLKNADPNYSGGPQGTLTTYSVRGKALWKPTDRLRIIASADYGTLKSNVELTTTFIDNINGFKDVAGVIPAPGVREVSTNEANFQKGVFDGGYVNARYEFDNYVLTSLTALRSTHIRVSLDNDRTNLALNRNVYGVYTDTTQEEVTLASRYKGPLNFLAGFFYFNSEVTQPYYFTNAATIGPSVNGVRKVTSPIVVKSNVYGKLDTDSYAAFGEVTYDINRYFSVVGGLRYSDDQKDALNTNLLVPTAPPQASSGEWSHLDHRATLNFKPSPNTLIYLSNSTGFKAGYIAIAGYSYPTPQQQVRPESVNAWELGYKSRWFNRFFVSASVFDYDYKDIQVTVNNALSAAAGVVGTSILQNAARAHITGADFDLNGSFDRHWSGTLGVSWLPTAEYSKFAGGIHYVAAPGGLGALAVASDISGSRILRSPEFTVDAGLTYKTPIAGGRLGRLEVTGHYFYSDSFFMVIGEASEQPSYSLLNAEVAWTDPKDRYRVSLWARNLTDEAYYISGLANTGGFSAVWGKPREIGVRVSVTF